MLSKIDQNLLCTVEHKVKVDCRLPTVDGLLVCLAPMYAAGMLRPELSDRQQSDGDNELHVRSVVRADRPVVALYCMIPRTVNASQYSGVGSACEGQAEEKTSR